MRCYRFDGAVDQVVDVLGLAGQAGLIGRHARRQPRQRHLDGDQVAAQVIVQLARDPAALVLSGGLVGVVLERGGVVHGRMIRQGRASLATMHP